MQSLINYFSLEISEYSDEYSDVTRQLKQLLGGFYRNSEITKSQIISIACHSGSTLSKGNAYIGNFLKMVAWQQQLSPPTTI